MTQQLYHEFSPRILLLSRGDERGYAHSTQLGGSTPLDHVAMGRASILTGSVVEVEILGYGA